MSVRAKPVTQMAIAVGEKEIVSLGEEEGRRGERERQFRGGANTGDVNGEEVYLRILVLCRRLLCVRDQPRRGRGGQLDPRLWSGLLFRRSGQRGGERLFRRGFRFEKGWRGLLERVFGGHWDLESGREGWFSIGGMRWSEGGWVWSRRVGRLL